MANKSTTFSKYDRNRYRKIYPITRYPESTSYRSRAEVIIESASVSFAKEDSKSGSLLGTYNSIPTISLGISTTDSVAEESNVNVFISSLTLGGDNKVSYTIKTSALFTGTVALQVLSLT
tara:strand:- start:461 stop:820 length:360 start_codon:yes stop_codon:yes gene_type:complete